MSVRRETGVNQPNRKYTLVTQYDQPICFFLTEYLLEYNLCFHTMELTPTKVKINTKYF